MVAAVGDHRVPVELDDNEICDRRRSWAVVIAFVTSVCAAYASGLVAFAIEFLFDLRVVVGCLFPFGNRLITQMDSDQGFAVDQASYFLSVGRFPQLSFWTAKSAFKCEGVTVGSKVEDGIGGRGMKCGVCTCAIHIPLEKCWGIRCLGESPEFDELRARGVLIIIL